MYLRCLINLARNPNRLSKVVGRSFLTGPRSVLCNVKPVPLIRHQPASTQVGNQLIEFLKGEIEAEKTLAKQQIGTGESPTMPDFQITTEEADVTLTKTSATEKIIVTFNVNHTVEAQESSEAEEETEGSPAMSAKPDFRVEIQKQGQKMVFECSFESSSNEMPEEGEFEEDLFKIDEIYIYKDSHDKVYSASGEVMDGTLYDHMMDYLAERGIDDKFAENLIRFATHYEHAQYVALLQKIKDFVAL